MAWLEAIMGASSGGVQIEEGDFTVQLAGNSNDQVLDFSIEMSNPDIVIAEIKGSYPYNTQPGTTKYVATVTWIREHYNGSKTPAGKYQLTNTKIGIADTGVEWPQSPEAKSTMNVDSVNPQSIYPSVAGDWHYIAIKF